MHQHKFAHIGKHTHTHTHTHTHNLYVTHSDKRERESRREGNETAGENIIQGVNIAIYYF